METYDFRVEPAAAWILGKRVADLADEPLREVIMEAIQPESRIRMINYFLRERGARDSEQRESEASLLLEAFEQGIRS